MVEPTYEPTKKCPYCYMRIITEATKCEHCDKKVGPPDSFGMGQKPVDWFAYIGATIALSALGYFCYWLFVLKSKG